MAKVSLMIPARNEPYLAQTIDDIYQKATGDFEVIVMLDGWKPDEPLKHRDNLILVYREESKGMRNGLNCMARLAKGKYLLKLDAHCMFDEGFDETLQQEMEPDWLVVPSRYRLDVNEWLRGDEAIEYLYVTFPYTHDNLYGSGFHGKKWLGENGIGSNMGKGQYYWMERARKHIKIDDIMVIQGSCWFMEKEFFNRIDMLDEVHSFFFQEGNELCFKTWMIGGRCVVNKNTWYAHWHKKGSPSYGMSTGQKKETQRFSTWVWMNDKWPKAVRNMAWFANSKFYPIPSWPSTWQSYVYPEKDFRIFDQYGQDGFKINGCDK